VAGAALALPAVSHVETRAVSIAQHVRLHIYEHFLEHSLPPVAEQLMQEFDLTRPCATDLLRGLAANRHVALVKGTDRILMAFPFSSIATPFVVRARGRTYYANCSWDSIAFHAMLGDDVRIDSVCHHCARPIVVELTGGRANLIEPDTTIVYLGLRPTEWWEDIITTCSNTMVFFCSTEHRDASELSAPVDQSASLPPDLVHQLSTPLYGHRLKLKYERPGRDQLNAHFAALGLTGPYWSI
jgi:hypothetical protein